MPRSPSRQTLEVPASATEPVTLPPVPHHNALRTDSSSVITTRVLSQTMAALEAVEAAIASA